MWMQALGVGLSLLDGMNKDRKAARDRKSAEAAESARMAIAAEEKAQYDREVRPGQLKRLSDAKRQGLSAAGQAESDTFEKGATKALSELQAKGGTAAQQAGMQLSIASGKAGISLRDEARKVEMQRVAEADLSRVPESSKLMMGEYGDRARQFRADEAKAEQEAAGAWGQVANGMMSMAESYGKKRMVKKLAFDANGNPTEWAKTQAGTNAMFQYGL